MRKGFLAGPRPCACEYEFMVTIGLLSAEQAAAHRDAVLAVWTTVFGQVEDPQAWTVSPWDRHRSRAGYRLALAHDDDRLVGFSWGYTGERGQYWSDRIVPELGAQADAWVGGHFEFVELAVLPQERGRGIGGQLHDALLAGIDHGRALLESSRDPEDAAVRLYASRGWTRLGAVGDSRQVMGLVLDGLLTGAG